LEEGSRDVIKVAVPAFTWRGWGM